MLQQTNTRTLRLLDAAEFIEQLPDERINLRVWQCGTQACYAGHIILKYGTEEQRDVLTWGGTDSPRVVACEILDIDHYDYRVAKMFLGGYAGFPVMTKQEVAKCLRQLAFE